MFVYVKFEKIVDEITTYEFRGTRDDITLNYFDNNIVSIKCEDESLIDELIASQDKKIKCKVITKDEFKEMVSDSLQLERIRTITKERIASKYSPADEIAMLKREANDPKRTVYEGYVSECISIGDELKELIGY